MTDNIETEPKPTLYTLEEMQAIQVVRRAMLTKPAIVTAIMQDASYEVANRGLKRMQVELNQLLAVSRAFTEAARVLAIHQQESEKGQA